MFRPLALLAVSLSLAACATLAPTDQKPLRVAA